MVLTGERRSMSQVARFQETLRRLAMVDEAFVGCQAGLGLDPAGKLALDAKTVALLQLAVSVATGSPGVCLEWSTARAMAAGATDDEIAEWIGKHSKKRSRADIVVWNNKERDLRLSDLSPELQEYMEDYIRQYVPRHRVVYHWFDVYDLEEQRL